MRSDCSASSGRTNSDDVGAARLQRGAHLLLAAVERAQPRFGFVDLGLDGPHIGCGIDQLLIELGAVLAERGDLGLELGLRFLGALLPRAGGLELLLALLDRIGRGGRRLWRGRNYRTLRLSLREACARDAGDQQQVEDRRSHRFTQRCSLCAHHAR